MGKVTDGKWWADGLEVGAGAIMDVKIAKVSGSDYDEAKANAKLIARPGQRVARGPCIGITSGRNCS